MTTPTGTPPHSSAESPSATSTRRRTHPRAWILAVLSVLPLGYWLVMPHLWAGQPVIDLTVFLWPLLATVVMISYASVRLGRPGLSTALALGLPLAEIAILLVAPSAASLAALWLFTLLPIVLVLPVALWVARQPRRLVLPWD